jgi:hypothetical protein
LVGSLFPSLTLMRPGGRGRRLAAVWAGALTVLITLTTPTPVFAGADDCSTVQARLVEAHGQSGGIDSDAVQRVSDELTRCRQLPRWDACEAIRQRLWDRAARPRQNVVSVEVALLGDQYRHCLKQLDRDPAFVYGESTRRLASPAPDPGAGVLEVWVLVFAVGGVMVAPFVALAVASDRRHRAWMQHEIDIFEKWAHAQGWTVHQRLPVGRWWKLPSASIDGLEVAAEGRHSGYDVAVAYLRCDAGEGGTISRRMCMARLDADRPSVMIRRRVLPWTRGGRIGDPAFDRRFVLTHGHHAGWPRALPGDLPTLFAAGPARSGTWVERLSVDGRQLAVYQASWPQTSDSWDGLVAFAVAAAREIERSTGSELQQAR